MFVLPSAPVYTELHCHSAFSFLDGASLPDELVAAALERGHSALALTDHNTVSGSMEFAQAAAGLGLRAIHGTEVDVVLPGEHADAPSHLTLLARDANGWRSLCRLLTLAHSGTRDHTGRACDPLLALTDITEHADGLVCLSGCARHGIEDEPALKLLREAFGTQDLYIEIQRPFARHDRTQARRRKQLARRLGLRVVATGNVHAHDRGRAQLQDMLVAVRCHGTLDASEALRRGNHTHVLTTPQAMAARFAEHPEAVAESTRLAESLAFDLTRDLGYRYPGAEDGDAARRLVAACERSFAERYPQGHRNRRKARERLGEELALIGRLGLDGFFLLHHELLELAREIAVKVRGTSSARAMLPPGRGRGSSVSSIVCYLTGLSHIDPIEADLFLGRFLNEEITALPDIDLDFPRDVRAALIPEIHRRFGHSHSALVAAFPTYRARGAIRDLGKALGLPAGEIERVARSSEGWHAGRVGQDIADALGESRLAADDGQRSRWGWLALMAAEAHGLPRHLSQHSGGMVIATRPLIDCCPVVPAAMEGRQMVMWDKDSCADAGFLKIDLLGLGMLSAVERCVDQIESTRGERVDLSRIPIDDGPTFDAIQKGETVGVFQIESRAQIGSLLRTRPRNLDELTIQVAIVRPGPIVGGAVNPYIERLQRRRVDPDFEIPYDHPSLKPVLAETLGTIIFQDQVIEVAMVFAGFSAGEAEGLRRAMSRKRSQAAIDAYRDRFISRAMERWDDVGEELGEKVWTMVKGFAGFGFPKAHSAAFGLLAYQSTWLRVHYAPEFLAALLDEQPMGFYPPDALIHEAQRRGLTVESPDVNLSDVGCSVTKQDGMPAGIRVGLGYVLGVKTEEVEALVAERRTGGRFRSLEDLAARAGAGRPALERLAWAGACDALSGGDRRRALWGLGVASISKPLGRLGTQLALPLDTGAAPDLQRADDWQQMIADYQSTGLTARAHPLALGRAGLRARGCVSVADIGQVAHGSQIRIAGLVLARQRPSTASGVCFVLLEDEHGTVNLIAPQSVYERHRVLVRTEPLLIAEGVLERHPAAGGGVNVVCRRLERLELVPQPAAEVSTLQSGALAAPGDFRAVAPPVQSFAAGRRR